MAFLRLPHAPVRDEFLAQIGEWCGEHGLQFTGHVLEEDTLRSQSHIVGCCMRHYEYMQAPGMDLLTEHWRCYVVAKQVTSAARQFGWKWRLTEIYGCTGWDFPFEAHKALGDWEVACGINLRCQHLSWYTMLAEAKRDYPAAIFYQSPWWEHYSKVEDYYARIHAVMTRGVEVRDLLVIHPVEGVWAMANREYRKDPVLGEYDQLFNDLTNALLSQQIDFDYGDEEIMSRHGKLGKTEGGATIKLAKATYKAVLVPPMKTMRSSTLGLLMKFAAAGGAVVFVGEICTHVDAEPSDAVAQLAGKCVKVSLDGKEMAAAVAPACRRVSITDPAGNALAPVIYLLREDKEAFYLFIANTSDVPREWNKDLLTRDRKAYFPEVRVRGLGGCLGTPVELDPETGAMYAADATRAEDAWEIRTSLPRIGSRLFVIPKQVDDTQLQPRRALRDARREGLGGLSWDITLSENNVLVLDRPKYKIAEGDWQLPTEILRVDKAVRQAIGAPVRGGAMCQPWAREVPDKPRHVAVTLGYTFEARSIPSGDLSLAIEQPQRFRICVNGQCISTDADSGWWTDKSLRRVPIDPSLLRLGGNEIVMECDFDGTFSGLEIAYLLGSFGTSINDGEAALVAPPKSLRLGDWVPQGLAFYSGSVAYRRKIYPRLSEGQRLFVRLGEYRGVAVRVLLDGKPAGIIGWEPCELDITDALSGREMELSLEVLGHRRNSHGPLHHSEKWPTWTGPGEFVSGGERWIDGYQLVPCGLMTEPQLITKE